MADDKQQGLGDPFQEAAQNPLPVKQTLWERLNTGSGIPMVDETLKRDVMQKQAQANLYHQNASQLNGLLLHLSTPEGMSHVNPQTGSPYTQDDIDQLKLQRDHAWGQYEKLVGIDKQSKTALQKAKSIIDFIHGNAAQRGAMAPPPTPDYPTTVGEPTAANPSGVTTTGVATPRQGPAAGPGSFATNVSDAGGVNYNQSTANRLTPPPLSPLQEATRASTQLPFAVHPARVQQAIADRMQGEDAEMARREKIADKIGLEEGSRVRSQFVALGSFPPVARLQKLPYKDPKSGEIKEGGYDSITGQILDQKGNVVEDAEPVSLASMTPKKITYKGPNGEPLLGFQVANKLYDQAGDELPEGTEAWEGTLVPKTTTGTTQKIDPLTGKRLTLSSSKTVAPSGTKITGPGGYKAAPSQGGGMSAPPTPQGGGTTAAPKGGGAGGGGKQAAPAPQSPQSKLSGPTGTRASQDAEREAAYLHRNNLRNVTSSTRTMIEAAPKVEDFVDKIQSQIDGLQNDLGPAKGRWNEFWAGKVGTKNPKYTALRTDVGLLSTLLMRMHVGARGGEYIMKHFEDLINQGKQDPDNLRAALKEIKDYADNVIQEGRQQGIDMAPGRAGGLNAPPSATGGFTPF